MAHNIKRTERMQRASVRELEAIIETGSLSAAAAAYELRKREPAPKTAKPARAAK